MRKGENAGYQHFLLFSLCFLPFFEQTSIFRITFILLSANAFNVDLSTILSFGKELWSNSLPHNSNLMTLRKKLLKTIKGKGQSVCVPYILPSSPQCFSPSQKQISPFWSHLRFFLQMLSIWTGWFSTTGVL